MTDTSRFCQIPEKLVIVGGSGGGRPQLQSKPLKRLFCCIGYKSNSKKATNTLQKSKNSMAKALFPTRLADPGLVERKINRILRLGELRCLINCVGLGKPSPPFATKLQK